jgi:HK97 family phage major capsid protein
MQSIQALRERRNALAQEVHKLLEENPGAKWKADPANQAKYDENLAGIDEANAEITRIEAVHERMTLEKVDELANNIEGGTKGKDKIDPAKALFLRWMRDGDRGLSAAEWADVRATMSTTTNSQGGYAVPIIVADKIVDALKAYGGMRKVATIIQTTGSGAMNFPTSDGTAEMGEVIAENTTATALDPSFGLAAITAWKFSSKVIAIPFELLQDAGVDMEAFIRKRIVTRIGRIQNQKFTIGTGTAEPFGVVPRATAGPVGATGETVTAIFGDAINLLHSVDAAYREGGTCVYMMADLTLGALRNLKDTTGRPIYIPGYDGLGKLMPDTLLGYAVVINNDVPVMAANAKSILFGDFSQYIIRDVMAFTLFRFDDSAYVKLGQIGFLAWQRSGGNLIDTAAVKYFANSAT